MTNSKPHLLEHVLGAKSKVAALRVLFQSKLGYSGSAVAKRSGMGLLAIQNALADLERLGLVEVERGAVEHRYRLNFRHYLVAHGLQALFEGERKLSKSLIEELRALLEGKVISAGLFGYFARGEIRAGSDIDLLVIVGTHKEKELASSTLSDAAGTLSIKYGLPVQAIIMERRQIASDAGNIQELLDEAERDWLPIAGEELSALRKSCVTKTTTRRKSA
jgi:predicted nucleotidyltransferase